MIVTNNRFTPVVAHNVVSNSMITGDDVDLNKQYKFIYMLENNNKPYTYNTTGQQMLRSFTSIVNQIAKDLNTTDLREIRRTLTSYVCPFATRQISKAAYRKIVNDYPAAAIQLVKNAVKDKSALQREHEIIEAYMYLKHIGANISENVLQVVDNKPDKYTNSELLKNWKQSPLVKSGYVQSRKEFLEVWKPGSLVTEWTTEN